MAAPPCPVCWANTRGAAAIAVDAAPVVIKVRLIESIIGTPLDHRMAGADRSRWSTLALVVLALKGRMPAADAARAKNRYAMRGAARTAPRAFRPPARG